MFVVVGLPRWCYVVVVVIVFFVNICLFDPFFGCKRIKELTWIWIKIRLSVEWGNGCRFDKNECERVGCRVRERVESGSIHILMVVCL